MAYLSDFVKSTLSRVVLGKEIPAFPYNIGDKVESFDSTIWALHKGTKRVGPLLYPTSFTFSVRIQED
jgi:SCY1-like protein 1